VFTARYALSPYIKQIRFVFKGLICYLPHFIYGLFNDAASNSGAIVTREAWFGKHVEGNGRCLIRDTNNLKSCTVGLKKTVGGLSMNN
jgi:hypothetical protein